MVFAKNSDRPAGEVQLAMPFGRRPTAGCTLRTQYLSIGDTGAHAVFLSCPTWLWGAEHGVNEFGVAIGNERVSTVHGAAGTRPALIGTDMVRLGLERARSAEGALDIVIDLLETYGQGGIADAVHGEAYDSSFLIADRRQAFVLDTSGATYAAASFPHGTAISDRLSVGSAWIQASPDLDAGDDFDRFRDPASPTASGDVRLSAGRAFLAAQRSTATGLTPAAAASHLRDHDVGVCMHGPERSVTSASFITVLPHDLDEGAPLRAYVALGSPCVSVYVPAFLRTVAGPPPFVPIELSSETMWRSADTLRTQVEADPAALRHIREVLDPLEEELWSEADEIVERPDRWSEVASSWGRRALSALHSCAR